MDKGFENQPGIRGFQKTYYFGGIFKKSLLDVVRTQLEEQKFNTAKIATEMTTKYELVHKSILVFNISFNL